MPRKKRDKQALYKRSPISDGLRFEILTRDKYRCQYCGKKAADVVLHVDHRTPVSKGGTNDKRNLVTSCEQCNLSKSDKVHDHDWQLELNGPCDERIQILLDAWFQRSGRLVEFGGFAREGPMLRALLSVYDMDVILEAIPAAFALSDNDRWSPFKDILYGSLPKVCRAIELCRREEEERDEIAGEVLSNEELREMFR